MKNFFKIKKPDMLFYGGIAAIVGGTIAACVATFKAKDAFENMKEDLEKTRAKKEEMPKKEYDREVAKTYIYSGAKFVSFYAVAIGLEIAGITMLTKAKNNYKLQIGSLGAALTSEIQKNAMMSKRIKEAEGEEAEAKYRLGTKDIEITDIDEEGVETHKSIPVLDANTGLSIYSRVFDASSKEWSENPEENMAFLIHLQDIFTDRLRTKGHVFLNEVYEALDIPTTEIGQQVGWCKGYGDDYVDFRIQEIFTEGGIGQSRRRFINGYENVIFLDFNLYGYIIDKVW